jgi:oligosaccharide amylase
MRNLPVGNGSLLVNFDELYRIRDIYFPHVGEENHTKGFPCRFGVWVDGEFSWFDSDDWTRDLRYLPETLVTNVALHSEKFGLEIVSNDTVASHENIFLRRVRVRNLFDKNREVRVFLHHDLRIYETKVGDTAFFCPENQALIHYKKSRYFLFKTEPHFSQFATGRKAFRDSEGTWRDAEDGVLSNGAITEGSVDSTISVNLNIEPNSESEFYYWICFGKNHAEVSELNAHITKHTPKVFLDFTKNYWRAWVNKNDIDFKDLSPEVVELFKRSLLIIRTQIDNDGAILAANDSEVAQRATDHYSYLWTRDGALVANALDLAGYSHLTRKFFDLCGRIVHKDGYFLQKYNPDGSPASGWHASWDAWRNEKLIPIQEDETALVLWALWEHYDKFRDIEFVRRLYFPLIIRCAEFMCDFRDKKTGLPKASWNLWEDRRGIHAFTCGTVIGGLRAAANFARLLGEIQRAEKYEKVAKDMIKATEKHLYSQQLGRFLRAIETYDDVNFRPDETIDASIFGLFYFGAFSADDELVENTMRQIEEHLSVNGGIARFQNDGYMRISESVTGNAWFICTLWLADYYIAKSVESRESKVKSEKNLEKALQIIEWTTKHALPSGVLAEQINPNTGEGVSVSPLTWSHSTFVATVMNYLKAKN